MKIPHRQKIMWIHRINEIHKDPDSKPATPQSSEAAWNSIIAANMTSVKSD